MATALRAVLLLIILVTMAFTLRLVGAVPVSLQVGSTTMSTIAPVAIVLVLAFLLIVFYSGRLTGWLFSLSLANWNPFRSQRPPEDVLADAYTALALNDLPTVQSLIKNLKPQSQAQTDLLTILRLTTASLPVAEARHGLDNPRLTALTALALARIAASHADWEEVRRLTTLGRQHAPENLALTTLQFKALVNLNDPAASELLPTLKTHLGPTRHKLLTLVLQGPSTLTARPLLDAQWVRAFQTWLPTDSDIFPAE